LIWEAFVSALDRIAHLQNRRDKVPNQELAREIVENLGNKDKNIQADCVKVKHR
jgi:hypothetical protein